MKTVPLTPTHYNTVTDEHGNVKAYEAAWETDGQEMNSRKTFWYLGPAHARYYTFEPLPPWRELDAKILKPCATCGRKAILKSTGECSWCTPAETLTIRHGITVNQADFERKIGQPKVLPETRRQFEADRLADDHA